MKLIPCLAIFALLTLPISAEINKSMANNGMLVMEDVPEIPAEIVTELSRYQNVRSAPFRGFASNAKYTTPINGKRIENSRLDVGCC